MTKFERIRYEAKKRGIIVERVGGTLPYEVYHKEDHGSVGLCRNLEEVKLDVENFAQNEPLTSQ